MIHSLQMNDKLCAPGGGGARWEVVDTVVRDGRIRVFDCKKHQDTYKRLEDINDDVVNGRVVLERKSAPRVKLVSQNDPALQERLQVVMRQVREVEKLKKTLKISISAAYEMAKVDANIIQLDRPLVSRATMYRYLEAKRKGLPLLHGDKNKGNREPRYSSSIYDLVVQAAISQYLRPESRWSIKDLVQYVNDQAHAHELLGDGQNISREFVRRCIKENASVDPETDRMDPKSVPAAKSIASTRILVNRPFERVEQDAVHLPFVVRTRDGDTSNVYLIHAIDCCTGMPLGWHMVIGSPCESDGLRCIESILFSKKKSFQRLGIEGIDVFGTPHQLIFDNGPETRGERMRGLVSLGIDITHCKSRHPQGKPFIERLNRSLKEAIQVLRGCTRKEGKDGQRDPIEMGDELMSPEELEQWIVRWYYEVWANTPLKRLMHTFSRSGRNLGDTPAKRWKGVMENLATPVPLSPSYSEWRMALYEHHNRVLSRKTGITIGGFCYRGEHIPYLVNKYGETSIKVLVNPDDYRQVFVFDGEESPLIPLTEEFVDENTPAYSFSQMKEFRTQERARQQVAPESERFRHDLHQRDINSDSRPAREKRSRVARNREISDADKYSAALRRAASAPLEDRSSTNHVEEATSLDCSFDDLLTLPVLNRNNGEEIE
jgi:putative transposase